LLTILMGVLASAPPGGTLLVAGDVTLGFHYEEYVDEQVKAGRPADAMRGWGFDQVRAVTTKADAFVVNLECPFTTSDEKLAKNFNFRARPELVAALSSGGVDAVSLANNHLVDYGPAGVAETIATLEKVGIAHFGAGRSLGAAREPALVDVRGVKVAFLGYFFLGDRNIEPRAVIATDDTPGVAGHFSDLPAMRAMVEADVRAAKKRADHVIPFFHWGRETHALPEPYQVELAHAAIDAGASAVLGSHPHVLQGLELYRGATIVYSLGNFVFGGNWDPKDKQTALVEFTVTKQAVGAASIIPAFSDAYPSVPVQPYLAKGEAAEAVLRHLAEISQGFPDTLPALKRQKLKPALDAGPDAGSQ
jgi:poly-gamma-glutamate synthesis protein (capsule biosynthesis protein)